ncbi:hypothetical protein T492DRAFT_902278 [Pavlovales sp. CCMP2436]|nr:hypothetical protein T492DRAFT_902278 [Pavlovales sp. CCMP2436]
MALGSAVGMAAGWAAVAVTVKGSVVVMAKIGRVEFQVSYILDILLHPPCPRTVIPTPPSLLPTQ